MSRRPHRALTCLIDAGYAVTVARSLRSDTDPIQLTLVHPELPTRYAEGPTIGHAMEAALRAVGLHAS